MRTFLSIMLVLCVLPAFAQENQQPSWQFSPALSLVKYFPGAGIAGGPAWGDPAPIYPGTIPSPEREFRYAGTGANFTVRVFNDEQPNLALTFGAGVTWFYDAERPWSAVMPSAASGIGTELRRNDFTAFPVSIGLQAVYPHAGRENFMLFGGLEGNLHLIAGNVPMADQAQLGFGLTGGFAVKIFEFGVRYTVFSDMKNLGAYLGFRLNPFTL